MRFERSACFFLIFNVLLSAFSCSKVDDSPLTAPQGDQGGGQDTSGTGAFEGYTLFSPMSGKYAYLIDMENRVVRSWTFSRTGGYSTYLLENGDVMRTASVPSSPLNGAGAAGCIQRQDWGGDLVWEFTYSGSTYLSHHDIEPMPNGNVLLIAWEVKSAAEAVAAGRKTAAVMWPDYIVEVEQTGGTTGNTVWEWHSWDHLVQDHDESKSNYGVVAEHPELIDINLGAAGGMPGGGDWLHINSISYNAGLDQIVIGSHYMNEFYVIDHSTTTAEAASHGGGNSGKGGDILYRWGCPANYGASGARHFDVVHSSCWISDSLPGGGNILSFNNGETARRSQIIEVTPPVDGLGNYEYTSGSAYGPASPTWTYSPGASFYSQHLGSCQRLPNGNTFIVESASGYFFEVKENGGIVWSYASGREVARAVRYAPNYPGLSALNER